jgi:hypothetical protein
MVQQCGTLLVATSHSLTQFTPTFAETSTTVFVLPEVVCEGALSTYLLAMGRVTDVERPRRRGKIASCIRCHQVLLASQVAARGINSQQQARKKWPREP